VPRDAAELKYQIIDTRAARPAFWEAEQMIKTLCR
jgi:hypothetical protein